MTVESLQLRSCSVLLAYAISEVMVPWFRSFLLMFK